MVFFRQAINKNRFGGGDGLAEHINRITADNNIIGGGEYVVIRFSPISSQQKPFSAKVLINSDLPGAPVRRDGVAKTPPGPTAAITESDNVRQSSAENENARLAPPTNTATRGVGTAANFFNAEARRASMSDFLIPPTAPIIERILSPDNLSCSPQIIASKEDSSLDDKVCIKNAKSAVTPPNSHRNRFCPLPTSNNHIRPFVGRSWFRRFNKIRSGFR